MLPLFQRAARFGEREAIRDRGRAYTYGDLLDASARIAGILLDGRGDLDGERIAFLVPPSFDYAAVQWGIWRAGGIAVPLALSHPPPELAFTLDDTDAAAVVATPELLERARPLAAERGSRCLSTEDLVRSGSDGVSGPGVRLPDLDGGRPAMLLSTSGTTGKPKGVLLGHGNLEAQVRCLVEAWEWTADDRILEFLPLHHTHGIVNVLTCALWSGAACETLERFDAEVVWDRLREGRLTLLMAVPTIYRRLIRAWEDADGDRREALSRAASGLRLMVSGSAALPVPVLERWREITGHVLLERYGMTEIGMALSNPYRGERLPGRVGRPLPGVSVRLVDEDGRELGDAEPGEIEVRGPGVFREYWRRPDATREAFRPDPSGDWFRTGDMAVRENGVYRILGRSSVDIIKTGGEKVSALEIENVLRAHPAVDDCAVVGAPDPEWGECVCAALICRPGTDLDLDTLRAWARERLAVYKVPRRVLPVGDLPRNAMGKVTKPAVARWFSQDG